MAKWLISRSNTDKRASFRSRSMSWPNSRTAKWLNSQIAKQPIGQTTEQPISRTAEATKIRELAAGPGAIQSDTLVKIKRLRTFMGKINCSHFILRFVQIKETPATFLAGDTLPPLLPVHTREVQGAGRSTQGPMWCEDKTSSSCTAAHSVREQGPRGTWGWNKEVS